VVLKATARDPAHRYQTPAEMAEDLKRFVEDRPVRARRVSETERLWRWCRRNPLPAGLLAGIVLVFLAGFAGVFWQWRVAERAREDEKGQRSRADALRQGAETARDEAKHSAKRAEEEAARANEQKRLAEDNLTKAEKAEKKATEQQIRADDAAEFARRNLYYAQMRLAPQTWRGGHRSLNQLREILDNWLPKSGSPDRRGWEWFYLNSLPYQNVRTLTESGRLQRPSIVAWHVGTNRLAEGTADGLIRIWDVDQEKTTLILKGSAPSVNYWGGRWLAWSPDGMKLAAGFRDTTVRVWETRSGRELKVFRGLKSPVLSVAFSSDGARLAAWGVDGAIKIWDANTGRLSADVTHPGNAGAGAWSPDDKLVATGHGDGTVTISGTQQGDKVVTLGGGFAPITDLAWSPDSRRLATASSYDYATRIWEVASEKMVLGPLLHSHEVTSVAWEPSRQRVATGSIDETVRIWDATTGREAVTLRGHLTAVTSLSWGPNGRFASACVDGTVKVWNSIRDQESCVLPGHDGRAHAVSWCPDGKRLASGGDDGKVRIWDAATRNEIRTLTGHDKERVNGQFGLIPSLAWSPDGRLLASAGLDGRSFVWEVATGKEVFRLPADRGFVWSVAWSPDGTMLAAGSQDGTIRVIEGLKHTPKVHVFKAHPPRSDQFGGTRTLAWSPQGDRLASGGPDGLVKLWDPIRGAELAHMQGRQNLVFTVAWSRDGKRLASGSADLDAVVWDAQTGRKLATMRGHHSWVEAVAWSPDRTRLASAGLDNSVRIWDPTTGEETFVLRGNSGMFHDVSWSPDGAQLAAASSDGQIWLWDATRGFERDTTARALPFIDRKVASGTARGEDLLWFAESYLRAGKPREALALVKDDPYGLPKLFAKLPAGEQKVFAQLWPDVAAARDKARAWFEAELAKEPESSALAGELADLLLMDTTRWTILKPQEMSSNSGVALTVQADREKRRLAAVNVGAPWAKLAAAYHVIGDQPALDRLLKQHPAAAAGIGDLYAAVKDWERAIAEYRNAITDQPADGVVLTKLATAYQSAGRTREAVPYLAKASAANPNDTILPMRVAALQTWFGQDKELAATRRRILAFAKGTRDMFTADRVAKACCLLPSTDKTQCEAVLALARKAVQLGKDSPFLPYFQLALGMAEYRRGHFAEAEVALIAAANGGRDNPHVAGTSAFFRAMCLFRQGKEAEARQLAIEAASKMKPLPKDENNPLTGNSDHDDLILWLAYKEAKALINVELALPPKAENDKN
jgi:WD40 repeat protein/tetratricopeptide (TPR) repeat protein